MLLKFIEKLKIY